MSVRRASCELPIAFAIFPLPADRELRLALGVVERRELPLGATEIVANVPRMELEIDGRAFDGGDVSQAAVIDLSPANSPKNG